MSDQPKDKYFDTDLKINWPGATQAAADVLLERKRQIEVEGWDAAHDDEHDAGELAAAGAAYALNASALVTPSGPHAAHRTHAAGAMWPWGDQWWKPKDARRDLVRAAALIIAEIERIDRQA